MYSGGASGFPLSVWTSSIKGLIHVGGGDYTSTMACTEAVVRALGLQHPVVNNKCGGGFTSIGRLQGSDK